MFILYLQSNRLCFNQNLLIAVKDLYVFICVYMWIASLKTTNKMCYSGPAVASGEGFFILTAYVKMLHLSLVLNVRMHSFLSEGRGRRLRSL